MFHGELALVLDCVTLYELACCRVPVHKRLEVSRQTLSGSKHQLYEYSIIGTTCARGAAEQRGVTDSAVLMVVARISSVTHKSLPSTRAEESGAHSSGLSPDQFARKNLFVGPLIAFLNDLSRALIGGQTYERTSSGNVMGQSSLIKKPHHSYPLNCSHLSS